MLTHHYWVISPARTGNHSYPLIQRKKRCINLRIRLEKGYICRQNISTYRWIKTYIIFLSFRVVKKNLFKRHRIKLCLMRTMIIYKTERPFRDKENKSIQDIVWNMRFYFAIQRMTFDLSSNKQSKWPHPKIFLAYVYKKIAVLAISRMSLFLRSTTSFCWKV